MKQKMIKYCSAFFSVLFLVLFAVSWTHAKPLTPLKIKTITPDSWIGQEVKVLEGNGAHIDPQVLRLSLEAYQKASALGLANKGYLTVIDYSKPSTAKRLWVFDMKTGKTLFNTWVSHGKNSGDINATSFSNTPGSLKSSYGVFVTEEPYIGKHGLSLTIKGLEHGINDNAARRAIVVHGASYVNPDIIAKYGRIGRSWGCPAVEQSLSTPIINTIKNKSVIFAYYPNKSWLSTSQFLTH